MNRFTRWGKLAAMAVGIASATGAPAPTAASAVNDWSRDEFQFTFTFDNPVSAPGRKSAARSTVYVYVPAAAKKVRALLLLQQNVVEQKISVHPQIRRVCDANDVAIAWCSPGFDLVFKDAPDRLHALIQEQFGSFGRKMGYPELGSVPLIAFGHSNTCGFAQNAAEARPDRVLTVLATHGWNGVNSFERYRGPVLVFYGTFWEQKQQALGNGVNKPVASLPEVQKRLERGWMPISVLEEYGSGHFDYSEDVVAVFAQFIDKSIRARLAPDGSLRKIDPNTGYIADIPAVPAGRISVQRYADAPPALRARCPWYFDQELAESVVKLMEGNGPWKRTTQLIGFRRADGTPAPFSRAGPVSPVPYRIVPGTNRIELWPVLLREFPADFNEAGQSIAPSSKPDVSIEYDCGPYLYRDAEGRYRVKLNRNGFGGYLVARSSGDAQVRPAVQGARFVLSGDLPPTLGQGEQDGAPQRWAVGEAPIASPGDQQAGARIALPRHASTSEYVGYFVEYGPARVVGDNLEILPLPVNTRGPVAVKLCSYRLTQKVEGVSSVIFKVSR